MPGKSWPVTADWPCPANGRVTVPFRIADEFAVHGGDRRGLDPQRADATDSRGKSDFVSNEICSSQAFDDDFHEADYPVEIGSGMKTKLNPVRRFRALWVNS